MDGTDKSKDTGLTKDGLNPSSSASTASATTQETSQETDTTLSKAQADQMISDAKASLGREHKKNLKELTDQFTKAQADLEDALARNKQLQDEIDAPYKTGDEKVIAQRIRQIASEKGDLELKVKRYEAQIKTINERQFKSEKESLIAGIKTSYALTPKQESSLASCGTLEEIERLVVFLTPKDQSTQQNQALPPVTIPQPRMIVDRSKFTTAQNVKAGLDKLRNKK